MVLLEAVGVMVAGKAMFKTAKAVKRYRARKRAERRGAPPQRIRPLGESEGTREDFKHEQVREEYSRLIYCCYTDRYRPSKWRSMQRNCPMTEEQEADAGIQHNWLLEGMDPNNHFCKLVIAIRGTKIDLDDLKANIRHTMELVHRSKRFKKCLELVEKLKKHYIEVYGGNAKDIVVTGHSLGASIAFLISLNLSDISPPHLFNQPCMSMVSLLDNVLPGKRLRDRMRQLSAMRVWDKIKQASDIVLAASRGELFELAAHLIRYIDLVERPFTMYINSNDIICKRSIIVYKRNHGRVCDLHRLDQETLSRALNLKAEYFMSLVPSVNMFISDMAKGDPVTNHGIKQWFSSHLSNGQHPDDERYEEFSLRYEKFRLLGSRKPTWEELGFLPKVILRLGSQQRINYERRRRQYVQDYDEYDDLDEDFNEEDFEDSDEEDLDSDEEDLDSDEEDLDSDEDDDWEEGEDYGDEYGVEYGYYENEDDYQDSDSESDSDEYED